MIDLQKRYTHYNKKYFNGRLPPVNKIDIEWSERMPMGTIGLAHPHGVLPCPKDWGPENCSGCWLRIDPALKLHDCFAEMTLLHEMAHIKAVLGDRGLAGHGPVWQKEMMRLARAGAFELWW